MRQLAIYTQPHEAAVELRHDEGLVFVGVSSSDANGNPVHLITIDGVGEGHGAALWMRWPDGAVLEPHGTLWLTRPGPFAEFVPDVFRRPSKPTQSLTRLALRGRQGLFDALGRPVPATSVTSFRLNQFVAHGYDDDAVACLNSLTQARFVRLLCMAKHLFALRPEEGLEALPETLDLLERQGFYAEVTIFADTASYPFIDYRAYTEAVGAICAEHVAGACIEIGNELAPLHQTQDPRLGDVAFLRELQALIPAHIPVSLGSTHADMEESYIMKDGRYLTVHGDRADGDQIPSGDAAGWRWIRHTNEQRALADTLGKMVWNDEPRRDDLRCDKHLGMALMARLFNISDTFHYSGGRFSLPPVGDERTAFDCRLRGWGLIPDDWFGRYANAGFTGSPVKSFDDAVRIYSSISGDQAYSLVLGAQPGLRIDWDNAWPTRQLVLSEGSVQLWQVTR